jgi:hypothetical protein
MLVTLFQLATLWGGHVTGDIGGKQSVIYCMSTQNASRSCLAHDGVIDRPFEVKRTPPRPGRPGWLAATAGVLVLCGWAVSLRAETIPVPNASFESPVTPSVDIRIDSWQETPKPFWYDESGGFLWDQLTGLFKNTDPGESDHIDNCDGNQAIWLFASPEVGLFQGYDSTDWSSSEPSHAFNAVYEVGKSYQLTVGIHVGASSPLAEGATLELSLYYRDAQNSRVTVAATSVTNTSSVFSDHTHLIDFQAVTPTINASDAWAGKHIGVQLMSTIATPTSGYWDLDNIRLTSLREPRLVGASVNDDRFTCLLESEPGRRFEILATTDLALPLGSWTPLGAVTNVTGSVAFTDPTPASSQGFYRARELP